MAAIAFINPFPNDVRITFQTYIQSPEYSNCNKERIPYAKWRQMHIFIDDPTIKPINAMESNLKHRALIEFHLINNRLYQNTDDKHKEPRYVVLESEAFDLIINEHLQLLHAS
jgi:hypothetical protein